MKSNMHKINSGVKRILIKNIKLLTLGALKVNIPVNIV